MGGLLGAVRKGERVRAPSVRREGAPGDARGASMVAGARRMSAGAGPLRRDRRGDAPSPRQRLTQPRDERVRGGYDEERQERRGEQAADDDGAQLRRDDRALVEAHGERDQREDRRD